MISNDVDDDVDNDEHDVANVDGDDKNNDDDDDNGEDGDDGNDVMTHDDSRDMKVGVTHLLAPPWDGPAAGEKDRCPKIIEKNT